MEYKCREYELKYVGPGEVRCDSCNFSKNSRCMKAPVGDPGRRDSWTKSGSQLNDLPFHSEIHRRFLQLASSSPMSSPWKPSVEAKSSAQLSLTEPPGQMTSLLQGTHFWGPHRKWPQHRNPKSWVSLKKKKSGKRIGFGSQVLVMESFGWGRGEMIQDTKS